MIGLWSRGRELVSRVAVVAYYLSRIVNHVSVMACGLVTVPPQGTSSVL